MNISENLFWTKIDKKGDSECWNWLQAKDEKGYGKFAVLRKAKKAHRIMWELTYGVIPDGLVVLHSCDNRACCNPNHLSLGTQLENLKDMRNKGRGTLPPTGPGEASPSSILTEKQVRIIKRSLAIGVLGQFLGQLFKVSGTNISYIKNQKSWSCVKI